MTMNIRIGTTLAIVAILLMMAASFTPRRISSWNSHTPMDEQTTATTVSPAPSAGNSALVVVMMRTQYDVFPAHAGPETERGVEPDVIAEAGLGIREDAGIGVWLSRREALKHERQHEHSGSGDRPRDNGTQDAGLHAEPAWQEEHPLPDHRADDHCG